MKAEITILLSVFLFTLSDLSFGNCFLKKMVAAPDPVSAKNKAKVFRAVGKKIEVVLVNDNSHGEWPIKKDDSLGGIFTEKVIIRQKNGGSCHFSNHQYGDSDFGVAQIFYTNEDESLLFFVNGNISEESIYVYDTKTCKNIRTVRHGITQNGIIVSNNSIKYPVICTSDAPYQLKINNSDKYCDAADVFNLKADCTLEYDKTASELDTKKAIGVAFSGAHIVEMPFSKQAKVKDFPPGFKKPNYNYNPAEGIYTSVITNLRKSPDDNGDIISSLTCGQKLQLVGCLAKHLEVKWGDLKGYVNKSSIEEFSEERFCKVKAGKQR